MNAFEEIDLTVLGQHVMSDVRDSHNTDHPVWVDEDEEIGENIPHEGGHYSHPEFSSE